MEDAQRGVGRLRSGARPGTKLEQERRGRRSVFGYSCRICNAKDGLLV